MRLRVILRLVEVLQADTFLHLVEINARYLELRGSELEVGR